MRYTRVSVSERGGSGTLRLSTDDLPEPGPGQALVRVSAAGVSFGDVLLRAGVIPNGPKPPFVPGFDITGTVERLGPGVTGPTPGGTVTALVGEGGYAEYAVVPADRLVPVPDGLAPTRVAAVVLNYFVAYQMLHRIARVAPGARILVHGGAGGVGIAFLQLAARMPLEVWCTCSAGKREIVEKLGARTIDYRSEDFVNVLRALTDGVDAVFDPVGGGHFRRSAKVLRRGGTLVGFGQSDVYRDGSAHMAVGAWGMVGGILLPNLVPNGRRSVFYHAAYLEKREPRAYREDLGAVLGLLADDAIAPLAVTDFPLSRAAEAQDLLEHEAPLGKIVLTA